MQHDDRTRVIRLYSRHQSVFLAGPIKLLATLEDCSAPNDLNDFPSMLSLRTKLPISPWITSFHPSALDLQYFGKRISREDGGLRTLLTQFVITLVYGYDFNIIFSLKWCIIIINNLKRQRSCLATSSI